MRIGKILALLFGGLLLPALFISIAWQVLQGFDRRAKQISQCSDAYSLALDIRSRTLDYMARNGKFPESLAEIPAAQNSQYPDIVREMVSYKASSKDGFIITVICANGDIRIMTATGENVVPNIRPTQ